MKLGHGSALECLRSTQEVRWSKPLLPVCAAFLEVTEKSVHTWLTGERRPTGFTSVRLTCFLSTLGYTVDEYVRLSAQQQCVAHIIALKLMSTAELVSVVCLDSRARSDIPVLNFLLRGASLAPERLRVVQRLVEEFSPKVTERLAELKARLPYVLEARAQEVHPEEPERIIKREVETLPVVAKRTESLEKDLALTPHEKVTTVHLARAADISSFMLARLHLSLRAIEQASFKEQAAIARQMDSEMLSEVIELLMMLSVKAK